MAKFLAIWPKLGTNYTSIILNFVLGWCSDPVGGVFRDARER